MSEDKPRRKHSKETIAKMSEKRRARTTQPRSGTSKKADNLYKQLKIDYKGHKDYAKILKWIEDNKSELNSSSKETRDIGILTDYSEQYSGIYELRCGSILFGRKDEENENHDNEFSFEINTEEPGYEEDFEA